jgi:hypothetical protein
MTGGVSDIMSGMLHSGKCMWLMFYSFFQFLVFLVF